MKQKSQNRINKPNPTAQKTMRQQKGTRINTPPLPAAQVPPVRLFLPLFVCTKCIHSLQRLLLQFVEFASL